SRLRVHAGGKDFAGCTVEVGGTISNRKGVNGPDVVLPLAALSDKDRTDLEFACELGVDWLALSFVQRPEDVIEARTLARGRASILSKIEKPAAVKSFSEILKVSDGIMVAGSDRDQDGETGRGEFLSRDSQGNGGSIGGVERIGGGTGGAGPAAE